MNIFEEATRKALRYDVAQGNVDTEDLWVLPMPTLDTIAKKLNKAIKEVGEESFIEMSRVDPRISLAFKVVKHVIKVRLEEKENEKNAVIRKARKEHILSIMANKQNTQDNEKSMEDLQKELDQL